MMEQITGALTQLAAVDRMRTMIGQALTPNQQMAISKRIIDNPKAFDNFIQSDEGRIALRQLADAFIQS